MQTKQLVLGWALILTGTIWGYLCLSWAPACKKRHNSSSFFQRLHSTNFVINYSCPPTGHLHLVRREQFGELHFWRNGYYSFGAKPRSKEMTGLWFHLTKAQSTRNHREMKKSSTWLLKQKPKWTFIFLLICRGKIKGMLFTLAAIQQPLFSTKNVSTSQKCKINDVDYKINDISWFKINLVQVCQRTEPAQLSLSGWNKQRMFLSPRSRWSHWHHYLRHGCRGIGRAVSSSKLIQSDRQTSISLNVDECNYLCPSIDD